MPAKQRLALTLSAFALFTLCTPSPLYAAETQAAAEEWVTYENTNALVKMRIPNDYQEKSTFLRLDQNFAATDKEISSLVDHRPFKNDVRHYIVKYTQTFGSPLTQKEKESLIMHELEATAEQYKSLGGMIKDMSTQKAENGAVTRGDLLLAYTENGLGVQNIRMQVSFTDVTKLQHIYIGPEDTINAPSTKAYLDSLNIKKDHPYTVHTGDVQKEWPLITTPLHIFSVYLPKATSPFVPADPEIHSGEKNDRVSTRFFDPVWQQSVFANVYGFEIDRDATATNVQELLKKRFIEKQRFTAEDVTFTSASSGNFPVIECTYSILPPEGHNTIDTVKLRALYLQNYVMVYEVMGPKKLVDSPFVTSLMKKAAFTPVEARLTKLGKGARSH